MLSTEVQRTLVKSPPELWAELSDAESLARHLGALGEIRITRIEPEREVRWEAERASGTVLIKPTGWGTKVELSVSHEPAPAPDAPAKTAAVDVAAPSPLQDLAQPRLESPSLVTPEPALAPVAQPALPEPEPTAPEPTAPEPRMPELSAPQPTPAPPALTHAGKYSPRPPEAVPQAVAQDAPEAAPEPMRKGRLARLLGAFKRSGRDLVMDEQHGAPAPAPVHPDGRHALSGVELPRPDGKADFPLSAIEALQARFDVPREAPSELPTALPASHQATAPAPQPSSSSRTPEADPGAPTPPAEEPQPQFLQGALAPDACAPPAPSAPAACTEPAENAAVEEVEALLTAMLDRLGAAHHRPFSRA